MTLGVTASFVMHFWFDQYYYWTGKKKLKDPSATNGVSGGILGQNFWSLFSFVFLWLIHCSVCAVVLVFRGEQSLLYQVMWARACVGICNEQTNLHPDGQTLTQLATSVHSVWWNACLLMQIFIQDLSDLLICICFSSFFVKLKSPFFLLTFRHPDAKCLQTGRKPSTTFSSWRPLLWMELSSLVWIIIWLMHHAECWDPSVGGRFNQVLKSKLCHYRENKCCLVSILCQSCSVGEFIQRTLQVCIYVWKPFLCGRCILFEN